MEEMINKLNLCLSGPKMKLEASKTISDNSSILLFDNTDSVQELHHAAHDKWINISLQNQEQKIREEEF